MLRQCIVYSNRVVKLNIFKSCIRSTCIMGRKHPYLEPSEEWHNGIYPELPEKYTLWEVKEQSLYRPNAALLDVLLTKDVPGAALYLSSGLGERGDLLKVNRQRFWRYLNLLGLAELPTPERVSQLAAEKDGKPRILRGDAYYVFKRLEKTLIHIPMNPDIEWTLTPQHVKVAFRKVGFKVDEQNLQLPDHPVTQNSTKPFFVQVTINGISTVPVQCSIFYWTRLDKTTVTKPPKPIDPQVTVDNWLKE